MMNQKRIITKMLIANRGEIVCRIIRTCREMGIATVAVYSDADANALHVEMADEAVYLGGSTAAESYLNMEKLIAAAKRTGANAIHPGYGFLAENAGFARAVSDAGLIFVGPTPKVIEAMGKKREAKLMLKGIPTVPGYSGDDQSDEAFIEAAQNIDFPIMVKASAGGGGKGMRQVQHLDDLPAALAAARREAKQAFGDDTLILEKVVHNPRHIEVQIFGDHTGHVIALGERECSIQRRHQKIIEESPSTALTPELRQAICDAAVSVGEQLGYTNAGTVEFLLDDAGNFYFMEMNTRLQVEHPVTEEVTQLDLVRLQIMVAEGHALNVDEVPTWGHAIEARIYAEDPQNGFLPVTGEILRWTPPEGVRIEAGVRSGDSVTVHYDPMIAKLIAYGNHREGAIRRLDRALGELQLLGMRSNIAFLRRVLMHPDHLAGNITTDFIDQHPELFENETTPPPTALIAAALAKTPAKTHWRNNPNRPIRHTFRAEDGEHHLLLTPHNGGDFSVDLNGTRHHVQVHNYQQKDSSSFDFAITVDGHRQHVSVFAGKGDDWWVHNLTGTYRLVWQTPLPLPGLRGEAAGSLRAPMPGQIISINVEIGQTVEKGAILLTLEAMKMEHRIQAPYRGKVVALHYAVGETVQADHALLELEMSEN